MEMTITIMIFFGLLFVGIPIAYGLMAASMFYIICFSNTPIIIVAQQMLKGVDSFTLLAVPFFVIAGSLMQAGGISQKIVDFAKKLVGHLPGGLAIVTTIASMIFAAMTGAGAATTAAVGGIMIPEMKKEGYDGGFACALQAVGGIFGPIIPPSILMVLYAVATGSSVGDMLMAGVIPGIVLGAILICFEVWICLRRGYHGNGHRATAKELVSSFIQSFWAMLAPLIILGGIYTGLFTPTEASAVACFYCLIIGAFVYRGFELKEIPKVVFSGVKSAASIMLIVSATQIFGWVLTRANIPQMVAQWFVNHVNSPLVFMLAVVLILLIAGCFIDAVPNMLIFAPILYPTAKAYGINLIYFGVVMVIALCIGLVTPPVGINLFVASSVGEEPIHKIIPHVWGFMAICILGMLLILCSPALSTFLPALLHG